MKSKIVTIVQVRSGSTRLPNKTLLPLLGKPLFIRQIERIQAATLTQTIVVATTLEEEDRTIEAICKAENILCYRGHPSDLLDRHYQAALQYEADVVIKIPSDCPLIDPATINKVIAYYLTYQNGMDYVSNLHPATYPDGNDVEIMPFHVLKLAWEKADKNFEREHTTPYIWERPNIFTIGNVTMENGLDYSLSHRWTIDYLEDYHFIKKVYETLYPLNPLFTMQEVLSLLEKSPTIGTINSHLAGVNWYRHHLNELQTISSAQTKSFA